jgi:hypothetical protein
VLEEKLPALLPHVVDSKQNWNRYENEETDHDTKQSARKSQNEVLVVIDGGFDIVDEVLSGCVERGQRIANAISVEG